jgi:hypothetical protein
MGDKQNLMSSSQINLAYKYLSYIHEFMTGNLIWKVISVSLHTNDS